MSEIDVSQIRSYLKDNPGFLAENMDIFTDLELPTPDKSVASFANYQKQALQKELESTQQRLTNLIETARTNQSLLLDLFHMGLKMGFSTTPKDSINTLKTDLLKRQGIDLLVIWSNTTDLPGSTIFPAKTSEHTQKLIAANTAFCGHLSREKIRIYFPDKPESLRSVALLPVIYDKQHVILALGSADDQRFHANMDTTMLQFIKPAILGVLEKIQHQTP